MNRKHLLAAAVLTALSITVVPNTQAQSTSTSTTTSSSSTSVTNKDTASSTSTRVTREQSSTTVSTSKSTSSETSSKTSSGSYVGVGIGRMDTFLPIPGAVKEPPAAVQRALETVRKDDLIKQGYLATIKEGGKWGVIGTDGQIKIAPTYRSIEASFTQDGTFFGEEGKNKYVHIDGNGSVLASGKEATAALAKDSLSRSTMIDSMMDFDAKSVGEVYPSDSYHSFTEKGKVGFKDLDGNVVIAPQFKEAYTEFSEDRAFVKANGKTVAIDGRGNVIFTAPSNMVYPYKNGLAEFRRKVSHFGLGNLLGLVGLGYFYNHGGVYVGEGFSLVDDGQKRGYLDRNGNVIIDSKNDYVYPMEAKGTLVRNEGKLGFMNRSGQYVIAPGNYDAGQIDTTGILLTLKNKDTGKYGIFDMETGKQEVSFKYDSIDFIGTHYMSVTNDTNRYVVDMADGRIIYKGNAEEMVKSFVGENYTWIYTKNGNYRILSVDGTVISTPIMKDISATSTFTHGYSSVKINGKWGIINSKGELVVQPIYQDVNVL